EQALGAEARHGRVPQGHVHAAAVEPNLGIRVAGEPPARLGKNKLAEAVEEAALPVFDAPARERCSEPKGGHLPHRVGQEGDADTELPDLGGALVHAAWDAALMEGQGEGQPPDPAADDGDVHGASGPGHVRRYWAFNLGMTSRAIRSNIGRWASTTGK